MIIILKLIFKFNIIEKNEKVCTTFIIGAFIYEL